MVYNVAVTLRYVDIRGRGATMRERVSCAGQGLVNWALGEALKLGEPWTLLLVSVGRFSSKQISL